MNYFALAAGVGLALYLAYDNFALEIFNALVPKDSGSRLLARDQAYGPHPRHKLDVYAPATGSGPWPTLMFVHGGSWDSGHKNSYEFVGRAFAAQGFVTFVPNYRLQQMAPFPGFVQDTAAAIAWASRNASGFGGDDQGLLLTGHSAGGYNVALAVLDKRYLAGTGAKVRAVALMAAPLDFLPLDNPVSIRVFRAVADLQQTQPIFFARADAPPFLLLHGTADTTCLPKNSVNLHSALQAIGGKSDLRFYQGTSHVGILLATSIPLRGNAPTLRDVTRFSVA